MCPQLCNALLGHLQASFGTASSSSAEYYTVPLASPAAGRCCLIVPSRSGHFVHGSLRASVHARIPALLYHTAVLLQAILPSFQSLQPGGVSLKLLDLMLRWLADCQLTTRIMRGTSRIFKPGFLLLGPPFDTQPHLVYLLLSASRSPPTTKSPRIRYTGCCTVQYCVPTLAWAYQLGASPPRSSLMHPL